MIRLFLEDALTDDNLEVVIARNGDDAMAKLDADAARFRGLVTDIDLGPGANGWEVARHARELVPTLPIIYVSGGSAVDWAAQGVLRSIMVPKPFVPSQIITALSDLGVPISGP